MGQEILACTWQEYPELHQPGDLVKLDPPLFTETDIAALPDFAATYQQDLRRFSSLPEIFWLNTPQAIATTLDKQATRQNLLAASVPMPPALPAKNADIRHHEELIRAMDDAGMQRVFVKPRHGSGAAGVIAYARNPQKGLEVLYSTLQEQQGRWCNTRRIHRSEDSFVNRRMLDKVLSLDAVVERWVPKDRYHGQCYDLRVVCLQKKILFWVARGSRGPITNLHVNNSALDICLSPGLVQKMQTTCAMAMAQFPGLRCAGLDVLLTPVNSKGEQDVLIIEVNGQGDLIYQDIFGPNSIYMAQIVWMLAAGNAGVTDNRD